MIKALDNLTTVFSGQLEAGGEWSLIREQILQYIEVDIREVYRLITSSTDPLVRF